MREPTGSVCAARGAPRLRSFNVLRQQDFVEETANFGLAVYGGLAHRWNRSPPAASLRNAFAIFVGDSLGVFLLAAVRGELAEFLGKVVAVSVTGTV